MSDLDELVNTITKQIEIGGKVFVYYQKDDGKIIRIANKMVDTPPEQECILTPRNDVLPVLNGFKRLEDYVVSYDPVLKDYKVVAKENDIKNLSINDRLYEIKVSKTSDYDIKVIQNVKDKIWKIEMNPRVANLLKKTGFNQSKTLIFSITKKNDPNVLFRRFEVNVLDLIYEPIENLFEYDWEDQQVLVSIYTNKYFDEYKHEIKL